MTNTFGIYRARMSVDGEERVVFEKDALLFDEVRYACASVLYDVQRSSRNEAVMLAVKGGNRLPMYKKAMNRGVVTTSENAAPRNVEITVEDDAGNSVKLAFTITRDPAHTIPERPEGRVASNKSNFMYYADGMAVSIPTGALYEPVFYTQSVVETAVTPRADSIVPLSPIYRIGDGVLPLHRNMKMIVAADIPGHLRSHACLAKVSDNGTLSYAGGTYADGAVSGSTRDFGTFCVVADNTPPVVKASFSDGDATLADRLKQYLFSRQGPLF